MRALSWGFWLFALTWVAPTSGATPSYPVQHDAAAFQAFQGTSHHFQAYGQAAAEDEGSVTIPLPFDFPFYGERYRQIVATSNGVVFFQTPSGLGGRLLPPRSLPLSVGGAAYIAPLWADLIQPSAGRLQSRVVGSAGSRVFELQYQSFAMRQLPGASINFGLRLHETSGEIELIYGDVSGLYGAASIIGDATGRLGQNLRAVSADCPSGRCACEPGRCTAANFVNAPARTRIQAPQGADLSALIRAPVGLQAGQRFDLEVEEFNLGRQDAGASVERIHWVDRLDAPLTTQNQLLQSSRPGLSAQSHRSGVRNITLPATFSPGAKYLILVSNADGALTEADLTNNQAVFGPIQTEADLSASLAIPARVVLGGAADVSLSLRNDGPPVGPVPVRLSWRIGGQLYLAQNVVVDMAGQARVERHLELTLPEGSLTPPLTLELVAEVDPEQTIAERDRQNNRAVSNVAELELSDLVAISLSGPDWAFQGQSLALQLRFEKATGLVGRGVSHRLWLSEDAQLDGRDRALVTSPRLPWSPRSTGQVGFRWTVSDQIPPGDYHVIGQLDSEGELPESDKSNNTRVRPIRILAPGPAVALTGLRRLESGPVQSGQALLLEATLQNFGVQAADTDFAIYLSEDDRLSPSDTRLQRQAGLHLPVGAYARPSFWVKLPQNAISGRFYLIAVVDPDSQLSDPSRADNQSSLAIEIEAPSDGLRILTETLPHRGPSGPYRAQLSSNVAGPVVWSVRPALPDGMQLASETGLITAAEGQPKTLGCQDYRFTLAQGEMTRERSLELCVTPYPGPIAMGQTRLRTALQHVPYRNALSIQNGGGGYQFTNLQTWIRTEKGERLWEQPMVPGLALDSSAAVHGEPEVLGDFRVEADLRDAYGQKLHIQFELRVRPEDKRAMRLAQLNLPNGVVGETYHQPLKILDGTPPYRWKVAIDGQIALRFDPSEPAITGQLDRVGWAGARVEVIDAEGRVASADYRFEVLPSHALEIAGAQKDGALPAARVHQAYPEAGSDGVELRLMPEGRQAQTWSVLNSDLPPGLSLDTNTGRISGTPTEVGVFAFQVQAVTASLDSVVQSFYLEVRPELERPADSSGCQCTEAEPSAPFGLAGFGMFGLFGLMFGFWRFRRRG